MRWVPLLGLVAACAFHRGNGSSDAAVDAIDAPGNVGPWLGDHTTRRWIDIAPGGVAAALTDMPIGIRIAADSDIQSGSAGDGSDLEVTADDGLTRRDAEIAFFDPATGAVELWVKVPTLQLDAVTRLYLYYGGTAAAGDTSAVWSSGFKGVWHMSGDAAAILELDSTSHLNHVSQSMAGQLPVAGSGAAPSAASLGRSRRFDGVDDRMIAIDPVDGSLDVGTGSFAMSAWLNAIASNGQYDIPFCKGGTNNNNPGYCYLLGTGTWEGKLLDDTGTTSYIDPNFSSTPLDGQWVHLVMSVERGAGINRATTYVDGVQVTQNNFTLASFSGDAELSFGTYGSSFEGYIDEARVYDHSLSPEWIQTEHDNLMKDGFITVGPAESR